MQRRWMKATYVKQLDELSCGKILERIYDRANVWNLDHAQSTRLRDDRMRRRPHGRLCQCATGLYSQEIDEEYKNIAKPERTKN